MWNNAEKPELITLLETTIRLPKDLIKIIINYCPPVPWNSTPDQIGNLPVGHTFPAGLIFHPNLSQVYVCNTSRSNSLLTYTVHGELIKSDSSPLSDPVAIDIDKNHNLYIIDKKYVTVLNLKKEKLNAWELPEHGGWARGLKLDNEINILYLTIHFNHQIYLYTPEGRALKFFGTGEEGIEHGQFNCPCGLTLDNKYLYICDWHNHRIQILDKDNGSFMNIWGEAGSTEGLFEYPMTIYLFEEDQKQSKNNNRDDNDGLVYVGDVRNIQIFTKDGICLQRLRVHQEPFLNDISGICIYENKLYVSDFRNHRILVFSKLLA